MAASDRSRLDSRKRAATAAAAAATLIVSLLLASNATASTAQRPPRPAFFTFETDEFWLNLHHFLYVLGRAEAKLPDATNPAVAGAQPDAERGFRTLTRDEQQVWTAAVRSYASGLSPLSNLDRVMVQVTRELANLDDVPALLGSGTRDEALAAVVERAAAVSR
jgi:hypothetical protein